MEDLNIPTMEAASKKEAYPVQTSSNLDNQQSQIPTTPTKEPFQTLKEQRREEFIQVKSAQAMEFDEILAEIESNSTKKNVFTIEEFRRFTPIFQAHSLETYRSDPELRKELRNLTNEYQKLVDVQKPVILLDESGVVVAELPPSRGKLEDLSICKIGDIENKLGPSDRLVNYIDKNVRDLRVQNTYRQLQFQVLEANKLTNDDGTINIDKIKEAGANKRKITLDVLSKVNPTHPAVAGVVQNAVNDEQTVQELELTFDD